MDRDTRILLVANAWTISAVIACSALGQLHALQLLAAPLVALSGGVIAGITALRVSARRFTKDITRD